MYKKAYGSERGYMSYIAESEVEVPCTSAKWQTVGTLATLFRPVFTCRQRGRLGAAIGLPLGIILFIYMAASSREAFLSREFVDMAGIFIVWCGIGHFAGRYLGRLKGGKEAAEAQRALFKLFDEHPETQTLLVEMWEDDEPRERKAAQDLIDLYAWELEYRSKRSLL